ncbi:hypothetical protein V7S43_015905 [Phytophthora oleae]|uniref:PiggyBac transposable element-derived protein domain-containing protein n=1 Tax=Phytophthora oleae TaxID=2107226 RepID=A0ABD3F099_9STRA
MDLCILEEKIKYKTRYEGLLPLGSWNIVWRSATVSIGLPAQAEEDRDFLPNCGCSVVGYYHGGLWRKEIVLLRLDISEQHHLYMYDRWYTSVKVGLSARGDVRHISLADTRHFKPLCRVYIHILQGFVGRQ